MGNRDASNAIILSGFGPALRLGSSLPPGLRASAVLSQAMSDPNSAMKPDAPIARTPMTSKSSLSLFQTTARG